MSMPRVSEEHKQSSLAQTVKTQEKTDNVKVIPPQIEANRPSINPRMSTVIRIESFDNRSLPSLDDMKYENPENNKDDNKFENQGTAGDQITSSMINFNTNELVSN